MGSISMESGPYKRQETEMREQHKEGKSCETGGEIGVVQL